MKKAMILGLLSLGTFVVQATPFSSCPEKAVLFSLLSGGSSSSFVEIDLATGEHEVVATLDNYVNAAGYNETDNYFYGVTYPNNGRTFARIGADHQIQYLNVTGVSWVAAGDVYDNFYYLQISNGLYKVDLSPLASDVNATLTREYVMPLSNPILDFAFNPEDGLIYAKVHNGSFIKIDPVAKTVVSIGGGVGGTFGAAYFDGDGNFYIGDNNNGRIYKVDVSDPSSLASPTLFANGPAASLNDGARCASAPLLGPNSTVDLGDAPDSYKTTLSANGPRHVMDGTTYLGTLVDAETDGQVASSDDANGTPDDEDGVGFVTAFELGHSTTITVEASTTGFLNTWIDWNADGDFEDSGEQVFTNQALSAGTNTLSLTTPSTASASQTWARFRFSQQTGLDYFGVSTSGEVEDHQIVVTSNGEYVRHFPSETAFATVAFEDFWPKKGDYDLNDVVVHYRITETLKDDEVIKSTIYGKMGAYGGHFHNGFAIRLAGLNASDIDVANTYQKHNGVQLADSGLESGVSDASFVVSSDLTLNHGSACEFYRTENSCKEPESFNFEIHVELNDGVDSSSLIPMPYDPFIIANTDQFHNEVVTPITGKRWEIHLPDQSPTSLFDDNMFGQEDDDSNHVLSKYFKTDLNHPWALFMTVEWSWPTERTDVLQAYPSFQDYVESGGTSSTDWHQNPTTNKLYEK